MAGYFNRLKTGEDYQYINKTQNNRHSENCKHFNSLLFDYNLSHLQKNATYFEKPTICTTIVHKPTVFEQLARARPSNFRGSKIYSNFYSNIVIFQIYFKVIVSVYYQDSAFWKLYIFNNLHFQDATFSRIDIFKDLQLEFQL